ncbi:MAG: VUT family protein [Anaeroplasmataceae bacterium]
MKKIKNYLYETKLILRNVPSLVVVLFVLSVVLMNLMANKVIFRYNDFLAADAGFLLSWIPFLAMDIITKRFGPKAGIIVNVVAVIINIICVGVFTLICLIPGDGNDYTAFNQTFSGTWFILLGSMIAMLVAGIVNCILNYSVGKIFKRKPDGVLAYVSRTYISTFIAQAIDNMLFALIVFKIFAPIYWEGFEPFTLCLCIGSGIVGATMELFMEIIFSPIGYRISKKWQNENVGIEYLQYEINKNNENRG